MPWLYKQQAPHQDGAGLLVEDRPMDYFWLANAAMDFLAIALARAGLMSLSGPTASNGLEFKVRTC